MVASNSINESTTGICGFTGTGFTGTAVTAHNVIIGGATSSTLANAAPSATSGVPLISQGAAADPVFGTVAIAGGGTNATSMSTSTGIVKYDGTSLVTSTTAKIDSSNRMTNTSQPCVLARLGSTTGSVTGDGTTATVVFATVIFDQGSNYNATTGVFTAPVTGKYLVCGALYYSNVLVANTGSNCQLVATSRTITMNSFNPFATIGGASTIVGMAYSAIIDMTANDTFHIAGTVAQGTKVVQFYTESNLSVCLLC